MTSVMWLFIFGDVVVHIFTDQERTHYDFDTLWKDAPTQNYTDSDEK